nr:hypothetical protein [Tanacetum cinerariifolium]
ESPENSSEENVVSKTNQEPPQDSDIHQLIEEYSVEVPEQQKQNMEKTMLDLVKICHHKQFLCIYDDVDNLIESALDSKLLSINSINSQRLDKKEQEVKIVEEQPAEHRNHAEKSLQNFRVTLGDKRECDELICENPSTIDVCDNHSEILFDSNNDDLSSDDESFEDIEYTKSDNTTTLANYSLPEYDSFRVDIEPDQERLINLMKNDIPDNSSNDPLLEEVDLFLFDDSIPPG